MLCSTKRGPQWCDRKQTKKVWCVNNIIERKKNRCAAKENQRGDADTNVMHTGEALLCQTGSRNDTMQQCIHRDCIDQRMKKKIWCLLALYFTHGYTVQEQQSCSLCNLINCVHGKRVAEERIRLQRAHIVKQGHLCGG